MQRTLSVTDTGDYHQKLVKPQILLKGKWLLDAGFEPGQKVEITRKSAGKLEITIQKA